MAETVSLASCFVSVDGDMDDLREEVLESSDLVLVSSQVSSPL